MYGIFTYIGVVSGVNVGILYTIHGVSRYYINISGKHLRCRDVSVCVCCLCLVHCPFPLNRSKFLKLPQHFQG